MIIAEEVALIRAFSLSCPKPDADVCSSCEGGEAPARVAARARVIIRSTDFALRYSIPAAFPGKREDVTSASSANLAVAACWSIRSQIVLETALGVVLKG